MLVPKLPSFFKQAKYKSFEYKPLYYNESKDEMKKRIELIKKELKSENIPGDKLSDVFRNKIRNRWNRKTYGKSVRHSNIRIIAVLFLIVLVLWFLFR